MFEKNHKYAIGFKAFLLILYSALVLTRWKSIDGIIHSNIQNTFFLFN